MKRRTVVLGASLGVALLCASAMSAMSLRAQTPRLLDDFSGSAPWRAFPSDGVTLQIGSDERGVSGRAMSMQFDFQGRAGYAIARGAIPLGTPGENWSLRFAVKGAMRPNTLEFKLVDASGDNVWWYTLPEFTPTAEWQTLVIRQRQVRFAWGPVGGGPPRNIASIEIVVTAGQGGRGTLSIDNLIFTPLPPDVPVGAIAQVRSGSTVAAADAFAATDGNPRTMWIAPPGDSGAIILDLGGVRTYGGVVARFDDRAQPARVAVDSSNDGVQWHPADSVGVTRGVAIVPLRDGSSRFLRLRFPRARLPRATAPSPVRVTDVSVRPLEFAESPSALLTSIAAVDTSGRFPRALYGQQTYWAVVGVSGGRSEVLFSEDGQLELFKRGPSLLPRVLLGGRTLSWRNVRISQSLRSRVRPIPTVVWRDSSLTLEVTTLAAGTAPQSSVYVRYRLTNTSPRTITPRLELALLPLQVNPPWQFLNTPGGAARVDSLAWNDGSSGALAVNGVSRVLPLTAPSSVTLAPLIAPATIASGRDTAGNANALRLRDPRGLAAATLTWRMDLAPGASDDIVVLVPLDGAGDPQQIARGARADVARAMNARLAAVERTWAKDQDVVTIALPRSAPAIGDAIKANLAWILINRDSAGIQPGSRSYERSWIRDGALTAEALLRLGRVEEARQFAEWYAPFQYPSGKVPCCVDARGPDPVDEHDSHGELIHLIHEVWRYSGDRAFAERMWPHVKSAVAFIDSLRLTHRTPAYERDTLRNYRGLLPASISHEGYSAKPMHSVWDDGFALLGLREATDLATALGHADDARRMALSRDEFAADLFDAIARSMARHRIPYIPGSIELGDFDATSTTTLLSPGGELARLPRAAVDSTFARYFRAARGRANPDSLWNDYTPYEWRTVGALVRLGWKTQALALLAQFMNDRRPTAWQQWAEVVWRDPRLPKFIGDMPHTWVGSDFIRSALDLFAYERSDNQSLIIGAGVPASWVREEQGVRVDGLRTPWGPLAYQMRATATTVTVTFGAGMRVPPGGLVVMSPLDSPVVSARADGVEVTPASDGTIILHRPARMLTITHQATP